MSISLYSVLTTFLWFNVFVLLLCVLRWKLKILLGYQLFPLMLLIVLSVVRLLVPVEPFFALEVESTRVLPFLQDRSRIEVASIGARPVTVALLAVLVLSAVSVVLLIRLFFLLHRKSRCLRQGARTDDPRLLAIFQRVKAEAPSRRQCRLYVSDQCPGPCIFGVVRSHVLIPRELCALGDRDLYYVLKHEWRHHLEYDVAVKLIIECLCCLLWWDPLVYLLRYNLNQTLELKCDAKVTREFQEEERLSYAEALMNTLRVCGRKSVAQPGETMLSIPFLGATLTKRRVKADEDLIQRFDVVLEVDRRDSRIMRQIFAVVMILLFVASFCFVIQPFRHPPEEELQLDLGKGQETMVGPFQIDPETAFLVDNQDGTYSLFVNGSYLNDVENIESDMFQSIPIINSSGQE